MKTLLFVILLLFVLFPYRADAYTIDFNQTQVNFTTGTAKLGSIIFTPDFNATANTTEIINSSSYSIINNLMYYPLNFSLIVNNMVDVFITLPQNALPNTYSDYFRVKINDTVTETIQYDFTVPIIKNYTISTSSNAFTDVVLSNVSLSSQKVLLNITLENTGNSDILFKFRLLNYTEILYIQPEFILQKFQNYTLPLTVTIPKTHLPGSYTSAMEVEVLGNKSYINFTFDISDNIEPVLHSINISNTEATIPTQINVFAEDNIKIDGVYAEITRPDNGTSQITLAKSSNDDVYGGSINSTSIIGQYSVKVIIIDTGGNEIHNSTVFYVEKLNALMYDSIIEFPPSNKPSGTIFTLTKKTPVSVSIPVVNYNGTWTAIITTPTNGIFEINSINTSITVSDIGEYYVELIGNLKSNSSRENTIGCISGELTLKPIEQHVVVDNIEFSTIFLSYTLEPAFRDKYGQIMVECEPIDRGNYQDSEILCSYHYPPDTRQKDMQITFTKVAYQKLLDGFYKQVDDMDKEYSKLNLNRWMWILLFFTYLVATITYFYILPRYSSD